MNYKIRVANEAESKEVQELLFELGYEWLSGAESPINLGLPYLYTNEDMWLWCGDWHSTFNECGKKKLTIPQLRDLVVLKRNDIADATHSTESCGAKGFLSSDGVEYFWEYGVNVWSKHGQSNFAEYEMKPITKEPVIKEFLVKSQDGKCRLETEVVGDPGDDIIEVPEGAEVAFQASSNSTVVFKRSECGYSNAAIVWQRETLNDKVASAEVARQEFIGVPFLDLPEFNFEAVDDFVESNVEQGAKHPHYKKDISHLDTLDIYRVTELFNPHSCGAHIAKKALCSGQRGHKDLLTDIQDIIDTAERWKEMLIEDEKTK